MRERERRPEILPVTCGRSFLRATTTEHDTPRLTRTAVELRDGPEDRQKMKTKMQDVDKAMVLTFNETFELCARPDRLLRGDRDGCRAPRRHPCPPSMKPNPRRFNPAPADPNPDAIPKPTSHSDSDVNEEYGGELGPAQAQVHQATAGAANAGVYVKNIVSYINTNGSIDKEFKLFSKEGQALGGNVAQDRLRPPTPPRLCPTTAEVR